MESHRILSFEQGVLCLKLKETFSATNMQISCAMARITRESVEVVKADSKGEVSSTSMTLSAEEMGLLERGRTMVKEWWDSNPLGERHVLLECGHIVNWDAYCSEFNDEYCSAFSKDYPPSSDDRLYCVECDLSRPVHRFNEADFEQVEVTAR